MCEPGELDRMLGRITPGRLRTVILTLASERPALVREGVSLHDLIDALKAGLGPAVDGTREKQMTALRRARDHLATSAQCRMATPREGRPAAAHHDSSGPEISGIICR